MAIVAAWRRMLLSFGIASSGIPAESARDRSMAALRVKHLVSNHDRRHLCNTTVPRLAGARGAPLYSKRRSYHALCLPAKYEKLPARRKHQHLRTWRGM